MKVIIDDVDYEPIRYIEKEFEYCGHKYKVKFTQTHFTFRLAIWTENQNCVIHEVLGMNSLFEARKYAEAYISGYTKRLVS